MSCTDDSEEEDVGHQLLRRGQVYLVFSAIVISLEGLTFTTDSLLL